jgi:hypothetical protein
VIGLVVGQVDLEEVEVTVDSLGEAESVGQGVQGAEAAVGDAAVALADLVAEVGGGEHGPLAACEVELVEPAFDAALASAQLLAYLGFHSKSLARCGG